MSGLDRFSRVLSTPVSPTEKSSLSFRFFAYIARGPLDAFAHHHAILSSSAVLIAFLGRCLGTFLGCCLMKCNPSFFRPVLQAYSSLRFGSAETHTQCLSHLKSDLSDLDDSVSEFCPYNFPFCVIPRFYQLGYLIPHHSWQCWLASELATDPCRALLQIPSLYHGFSLTTAFWDLSITHFLIHLMSTLLNTVLSKNYKEVPILENLCSSR